MTKKIDYYREKLLEARQDLLEEIDRFNEYEGEGMRVSIRESTGELSNYDNHPADVGSSTFEREKDLGMQGNAKVELEMVNDALEKIEAGKYGVCDYCEEKINEERLKAIPHSTLCKDCKEKLETKDKTQRPIEEEVISETQGDKFSVTDESDNNSYDGEDTWQGLAKVGTSNTPSDFIEAHDSEDSYIDADENQDVTIYKEEHQE
jgi:YteA family regulatory protein